MKLKNLPDSVKLELKSELDTLTNYHDMNTNLTRYIVGLIMLIVALGPLVLFHWAFLLLTLFAIFIWTWNYRQSKNGFPNGIFISGKHLIEIKKNKLELINIAGLAIDITNHHYNGIYRHSTIKLSRLDSEFNHVITIYSKPKSSMLFQDLNALITTNNLKLESDSLLVSKIKNAQPISKPA